MALPLLTLASRQKDRLSMIETALKDQAPKTYRDLKLRGKLQAFLENHEQAMVESYDQRAIAEREKVLSTRNPNLNRAPELDAALHRVWEETLALWLEFNGQDENTTIGSSPEA